jgi:hypothetical protein
MILLLLLLAIRYGVKEIARISHVVIFRLARLLAMLVPAGTLSGSRVAAGI